MGGWVVVRSGGRGTYTRIRRLIQAAASQVIGDDHIRNGVEHKLNVVGVRSARLMAVDLLRG